MDKKKKLIIEIVLFVLFLIGMTVIYNYLINIGTEQSTYGNGNILKDEEIQEKSEIIEIKNTEQFEQEVINENGVVFIDFYATWCIPCRTMKPIIEELSKEHKDVKFVKIDVDKNEDLAIKYNVMSIPTMLVMKNGEVDRKSVV